MIRSRAVFQTMNTAGVLRDVAANRARWLAGRIGDVIETVGRHCAREMRIYQAGLHNCQPIFRVNAQNLAHSREFDHDAAIDGQSAARQTRACAARREAHVFLRQKFDDFRCLFS